MKRLLLVILLAIGIPHLTQGRIYLVSVGVADYPGTKNDLRVSDNDAKSIANVFAATQNALVYKLINEGATQSAIINTIHSTFSQAQEGDAVILYFSGHGVPGALVCYDGRLSYQRIFQMLNASRATKKIIITDACYAGKMRTSKQQSNNYNNQNVMLFLSSRTDELSKETQFKNSLFTIFLERGLRGGADKNRDRRITAREIYEFVHEGVAEASGGGQHPVMWGKFDNDMTIINW